MISSQIKSLVAQHVLKNDARQLQLASKLDRLSSLSQKYSSLRADYFDQQSRHDQNIHKVTQKYKLDEGKLKDELAKLPAPVPPPLPRGLFITGKVGTGKSMLMNLFLNSLSSDVTYRRVHFHAFLQEVTQHVHETKKNQKQTSAYSILTKFGNNLGSSHVILALDEFLLPDAGTNLMLQPVLEAVLLQSILVVTSNVDYVPDYLARHCKHFDMKQDRDYRLGSENSFKFYGPCHVVKSEPHSTSISFESNLSSKKVLFMYCFE